MAMRPRPPMPQWPPASRPARCTVCRGHSLPPMSSSWWLRVRTCGPCVSVRRENMWLEIEINTDILFPSGSGGFASQAEPVLDKLAEVLKPFPNPIRVEGHTDDRPIRTAAFPSNWELSAARAASVVHQFTKQGIDPLRLEIVGFGEFHPRQANDSSEGRNANRRVAGAGLPGRNDDGQEQ